MLLIAPACHHRSVSFTSRCASAFRKIPDRLAILAARMMFSVILDIFRARAHKAGVLCNVNAGAKDEREDISRGDICIPICLGRTRILMTDIYYTGLHARRGKLTFAFYHTRCL